MLDMIKTINEKLNLIVRELEEEKGELTNALKSVQEKIDSKIEEAKGYKVSVDTYKEDMNLIEQEILSLEKDLENLKENYGNKGFDAIVEVGTKEINAKIISKQKELAKQAQRINELTEKARTIKDLLINLKKDKEEKKTRLDNLEVLFEYYNGEFSKIIEYSENNSEELVSIPAEEVEYNLDVPVIEDIIDDAPVFDEIESIDKDENKEEAPVVEEVKEVEEVPSEDDNQDQEDDKLFDTMSNIDVSDLFKIDTEEDNEDSVLDDKKDSLDDTISALFASEETQPIDFKKLNDSINEEYESIFGNSDDIDITEDKDLFITGEETNSFDINSLNDEPSKEEEVQEKSATTDDTIADIFGTRFKPSYDKGSSNDDIVNNFFMTNKLDFNKFTVDEQEYLKKVFSPIAFAKILDILRKNDIDINKVYDNIKLFEMGTTELEGIINKLLISGQSKANISLVLNVLPMIRLTDLNEVLESFGPDAAKADITDILIKAKHLNDIGGSL